MAEFLTCLSKRCLWDIRVETYNCVWIGREVSGEIWTTCRDLSDAGTEVLFSQGKYLE